MKGWLDKYEQGGMVLNQKTNDNYGLRDNPSDSSVSLPKDFVGQGYNTKGRNYSPAWGGQFADGGWLPSLSKFPIPQVQKFMEPTDPRIPAARRYPQSDMMSNEIATSIGGERDEPAYLIPSFKHGKFLENPLEEYRKTGEHLGGPFKTWQEADKWDQEVRHPYVEKGQDIPTPLRRWGKDFEDGGKVRPSFDEWYKTVPKTKNDTTSYNLRRAYDLAPQEQLDQFATNPNAHLMSAYEDPKTGIYEFMKSKNHPTLKYELDWYNSPEGKEFKATHDLDKTGEYYKYIPKKELGGSVPGVNAFMYARHGAPSEGPYAKKTMPSAQNGQEMQFFQQGLDWKPKTISRDGSSNQGYTSQADSTRVDYQPIDQSAKAIAKKFQQETAQNRHRDIREGYISQPESSNVIIQDPNSQVIAGKIKRQKMQDEYTRLKQEDAEPTSWWNKKIGVVDFTPEQQDFELQRRATNAIEEEYVPFEQKAQEYALHFAASILPEIGIGKALQLTQGMKGFRNLGGLKNGIREVEPLLEDAQLIRRSEPLKNVLSKITDVGIYSDNAHQQYNTPEEIEQSKIKYAENLLPRKDQKYNQKLTTIKNQNFQNGGIKFKNKKVQEFPMSKNGNALTRLDQLTNFTNYNTKQPGGWLDKYQ